MAGRMDGIGAGSCGNAGASCAGAGGADGTGTGAETCMAPETGTFPSEPGMSAGASAASETCGEPRTGTTTGTSADSTRGTDATPGTGKARGAGAAPAAKTDATAGTGTTTGTGAPLFEDAYVLAWDKPAGIIVHGAGTGATTLTDEVIAYLRERDAEADVDRNTEDGADGSDEGGGGGGGGEARRTIDRGELTARRRARASELQALQRLDRETSGIVLFSTCKQTQPAFDRLIAERRIRKRYLAIVEGAFPREPQTFDGPIGRDRHRSGCMRVSGTGKPALTVARCIAYAPADGHGPARSLVLVELHTGRRHQIRVHLAHAGFPIVGDALYGGVPAGGRAMVGQATVGRTSSGGMATSGRASSGDAPAGGRASDGRSDGRSADTATTDGKHGAGAADSALNAPANAGGTNAGGGHDAGRTETGLMLHAFEEEFTHPVTGELIQVRAPYPERFVPLFPPETLPPELQ